jgi:hypothetical protein
MSIQKHTKYYPSSSPRDPFVANINIGPKVAPLSV